MPLGLASTEWFQERDTLRCDANGNVTFQYRHAKTGKMAARTLPGADFLWLVLQHVLPKGLRRARNFGFLHPNSARAIRLLQVLHLRGPPALRPRQHGRPGAAPVANPCMRCAGACPRCRPTTRRHRNPCVSRCPTSPTPRQPTRCPEHITASTLGNGLNTGLLLRLA